MTEENKDHWDKVLHGAKAEGLKPKSRPTDNDEAPFGFATRVVAQWIESRRDAVLAVWRRWSWTAAACSVALAAVSLFFVPPATPSADDMLIPTPELEIPDLFSA